MVRCGLFRSARIVVALAFSVISVAPAARADDSPDVEPPYAFADYEVLQYITSGNYPPSVSMELDNNGAILLACREAQPVAALRASGLEFADSQVEFLIVMNLLGRDEKGNLGTLFPILDEDATEQLRLEAGRLAAELAQLVKPDAEALVQALDEEGYGSHAYTVLMSHLLDGMAWGFLEEYGRVPRRVLSARTPFWSGVVWALKPARDYRPTTKSIASGGLSLRVSSLPQTAGDEDLFANPAVVKLGLEQFKATGSVAEGATRELFVRFGLVDAAGNWTIPIMKEREKGPVSQAAETLTERLVDSMLERIQLPDLQQRFGFRSSQQALVVYYHELMWGLMERFEADGLALRPAALGRFERSDPSAAGGGALLIDRRTRAAESEDSDEPRFDRPEADRGEGGAF